MEELNIKGAIAKECAQKLINTSNIINSALLKMADNLEIKANYILAENNKDIKRAKESGMNSQLLDRLQLNLERIGQISAGIRQVAKLDCPLGKVVHRGINSKGLKIEKITVPLGVVGIIYEARPNVTADAAVLCLKSGNAVILRGGKEAINSNIAIVKVLTEAAVGAGLPEGCIQLIEDTSRESAMGLMKLNKYLDVIIPRGGAGLIRSVSENATVPAIETGVGNCHIYIDKTANLEMAEKIVINAKTSRPSVCNSTEKLLIHEGISKSFLPKILDSLAKSGVEIKGCKKTCAIYSKATLIPSSEWPIEYLDLIIGVKVVKNIDEAINHINEHSSSHSDAIITEDNENAEKFLSLVDSSSVYVNASTRFTDGFEFGLGAEIGISTQKVHARGPVGLEGLTSTKYIIRGEGQVR